MLITFDFQSDIPLYQQLRDQVVIAVSNKVLRPGEHLPTVRALADESGVNTMTISKAYQLLKHEGYINTERRGGAVIAKRPEKTEVPDEVIARLKVCVAELKNAGIKREQLEELCDRMFEEKDS